MALKTYAGGCPYRVGSYLYTDDKNFNPNTTYSNTTWERVKGRTVVGVDENDADFSTVKKLGGHKTSQQIKSVRNCDGTQLNSPFWVGKILITDFENKTGGGVLTGVSLLQPYRTTYIWVRTK